MIRLCGGKEVYGTPVFISQDNPADKLNSQMVKKIIDKYYLKQYLILLFYRYKEVSVLRPHLAYVSKWGVFFIESRIVNRREFRAQGILK